LIGMMFYFKIYPTTLILLLPFLVIVMMLSAGGVGMFLSALNAKYRDVGYTLPFLLQIWMFSSPIVYPTSIIPEKYRIFYALNPMVGVIEGFRSTLLGNIEFPTTMFVVSALVSCAVFSVGLFYFKQRERFIADII
jgi:lipopolysaccharide transport system permease protein